MAKHRYRNYRRKLRLNFYTSSVDKLLQARLLFSEHGYRLGFFRGRIEPYDEDYSQDTKYLLTKGVAAVKEEFGLLSPFFIEDTSIRIDALSSETDFPGMQAKEWFATIEFAELDEELRARGNRRSATVKSDIALHLPNFPEPIFFHGETTGEVAEAPPKFEENSAYPWLTPRTFNGWFVPDGQLGDQLCLGEMAYESSLDFDFRARSLRELVTYYDQLNAVLNIAPANVDGGQRRSFDPAQMSLSLQPAPPVLCVIGEKCAGKTTLANLLIKDQDAVHIEASAQFQEIASELGATFTDDSDVLSLLASRGYDIVARRVVDRLGESASRIAVITGLRTPEEISYLARAVESLVVVYVSTDTRIRYERHLKRKRDPSLDTYKDFTHRDELQREFGLLRIASDAADVVIQNDGSLAEFSERVAQLAEGILAGTVQPKGVSVPSETVRSLRALQVLGRQSTCAEISAQSAELGPPVRLYNTNRALKAIPEFAKRVESRGHKLSYAPTDRTAAALAVMSRTNLDGKRS